MHSTMCERSLEQSIPTGFPPHDNLAPGTEDSSIHPATPDIGRTGRVLTCSTKSPEGYLNCYYTADKN